jgi:hopanoid biosynthesis associated protein HpnK
MIHQNLLFKMTQTFLIVTADDLGRSHDVNNAVEQAATYGILTCTSLMINGEAVEEALSIARSHPTLQTSLHLALTEMRPLSSIKFSPLIKKRSGPFRNSPAIAGLGIHLSRKIYRQIEKEVHEQFRAFAQTNLAFDHMDSHHHLHIHPKLFDMVIENALLYNLKSIRIPFEPWHISGPLCEGHLIRNWFYRKVFPPLTSLCRKKIISGNLISTDGVFGLYQTGGITEQWLIMLLDRLKNNGGVYELYTHPSTTPGSRGKKELEALLSPQVKEKLQDNNIQLIRYHDRAHNFFNAQ